MPDVSADTAGVVQNPWQRLREFTDARIALGRAGVSLPTAELLAFQLAHAQARDAVHLPLNVPLLVEQLQQLPEEMSGTPPHALHSRAADRPTYLQRPDLGRRLDDASRQQLQSFATDPVASSDLALVLVDGLSARAVQQHAVPFIKALLAELGRDQLSWSLAPLCTVEQGRVAIGDEVGELLNARCVLVLIGERPGLSSPDSLGLYLTWAPGVGLTDAFRNCISNVRPAGLGYMDAAHKAAWLLRESRRLKLSGVGLKDRTEDSLIEQQQETETRHFLLY